MGHRFYDSVAKRSLQNQCKSSWSDRGGGRAVAPSLTRNTQVNRSKLMSSRPWNFDQQWKAADLSVTYGCREREWRLWLAGWERERERGEVWFSLVITVLVYSVCGWKCCPLCCPTERESVEWGVGALRSKAASPLIYSILRPVISTSLCAPVTNVCLKILPGPGLWRKAYGTVLTFPLKMTNNTVQVLATHPVAG